MSVDVENPVATSIANGVSTVYPHSFTLLSASDLVVKGYLAGVLTPYVLNVDYTVTGVGTNAGSVVFTLPPPNGMLVRRFRQSELKRDTEYQNNGDFPAATINDDLNRIWYTLQEILGGVNAPQNSLRGPAGEGVDELPQALDRRGLQLLFHPATGQPLLAAPVSGTAADVLVQLASTANGKGDALIGVKLDEDDSVARTQHDKNADHRTVLDFRDEDDADDTEAVERSLAAMGRAHFPYRGSNYTIRRTIRASTAVQITQDPGVLIQAASGFTGISVTKDAAPYTLKAMFAVFTGSTINTQSGTRIGETGLSARIDLELDCANNAEVGIYAERCPGIRIESGVMNTVDGIFIGPFCWATHIIHPKILSFTGTGIELGFGANGALVDTPEIWGYTVEGAVGILCRGNNNGLTIQGGYIEGVVTGFYSTAETGAVDICGVDFEVISGNCIKTLQIGGETRSEGPINVTGCYLDSTQEVIHNTGARIISKGNRYREPAATSGSHFYSANAKSVIISEGDSFDTTSGTAIAANLSASNSVTMTYIDGAAVAITNRKTTATSGAYFANWGLYHYTSNSQPNTLSASLEFFNSRQGGATNIYSAKSTWLVNETETDATPANVIKYQAGVDLSVLGGVRTLAPVANGNHRLGNATFRWSEVFAMTGTINTSDSREKQQVRALSVAEQAVAVSLKGLLRAFKFNSAVAEKGDDARWHFGIMAQDVVTAFAAQGLDATDYGLLCFDEWDENPATRQAAGDIYGVRYEELLAFIVAAL